VLLLIQGVLDRTKILNPMPVQGINICDLNQACKYFDFIYDAERLLSDGRPSFNEWLREINSQIEVGCRVVGNWHGYSSDGYCGKHERVYPRTARSPNDEGIYVLEKPTKNMLSFYYPRTGDKTTHGWDDWRTHDAVRRARYDLYPNDRFFIHFDAAEVEDMEYYISSRLHRHQYKDMIPLMQTAIEMKKKEKKQEAPFRKLLLAEIVKTHGCTFEHAESMLDTLVHWWKFKNKTHRALTSDDSKAVRMIVAEFGRRDALEKQQQDLVDIQKQVVDIIKSDDPNVLAVFHRNDNAYVSFSFHNDKNVFLREQHWELDKNDELECVYDKSWKVADKRYESWKLLWQHERWSSWKIGVSAGKHLTDEEIELAVSWALDQFKPANRKELEAYSRSKGKQWLKPLAIYYTEKGEVLCWYMLKHGVIPKDHFMTKEHDEPEAAYFKVVCKQKGKELVFSLGECHQQCIQVTGRFDVENPKEIEYARDNPTGRILRRFEETIKEAVEEERLVKGIKAAQEEALKPYSVIDHQIYDFLMDEFYKKAHERFLEDYVDDDEESMWKEHKRELKEPRDLWPRWVDDAVGYIIEANIDCNGMTIEQFVEKAKSLGFKWSGDPYENEPSIKDIVIDLSYQRKEFKEEGDEWEDGDDDFGEESIDTIQFLP
jgi:hypothetical protein